MLSAALRLLSLALIVGALGVTAPAAGQGTTVEALLQSFSSMPGLTARFVEEKRIALLAMPLRSEGTISFVPPGRLLRRVTSPVESVALLEEDQLTLAGGGERQRITLGQNEVVDGFVNTFRDILAGDQAALERSYELELAATDDGGFRLTLTPRGAALARFLQELVLTGRGQALTSMRMLERSGDTTVTTFSEVDHQKRWSPAEIARVFRLP